MELSRDRLLLASNGEETIINLNGHAFTCTSLKLTAEHGIVYLSMEEIPIGHSEISEARFQEMLKMILGDKLCSEG